MSPSNIQVSFDETVKDSDLGELAIDLGEITIDSLMSEGPLTKLPIISSFVSLAKFGANIQDRLFLKKIIYFLNQLKDVSPKDRKRMINKIDASKEYRLKVGEKLLYIIDSCNDYENSELVARLFKAFIEKEISYSEFLGTSNIIEKITNSDLRWFLKADKKYLRAEDIGGLISSGLFDLYYDPVDVQVEEETDHKVLMEGGRKFKTDVDGGEMRASISSLGQIILNVLSQNYVKPKVIKI